jgi:putative ABC transport system substrate-binding protein
VKRRDFVVLFGGAALGWPIATFAQSAGLRHVGILMPFPKGDAQFEPLVTVFRKELHRLGWMDGRNVQVDERWTADNMDRVRVEAASLVAAKPAAIVAIGGRVIPILMQLTSSIPIVIPGASDPVGNGYVKSLARPGGNVTGVESFEFSVIGKALEILKDIAPSTSRVAMFYNPDNPNSLAHQHLFTDAARQLKLEPLLARVHTLADFAEALARLAAAPTSAALFPNDVTTEKLRQEVVGLVAKFRLPAIYQDPAFVRIGGLAAYGADRSEAFRVAAGYVNRILRGEKPGDLPFQKSTYRLAVNNRAAKAMGLRFSTMLLARADEVVE